MTRASDKKLSRSAITAELYLRGHTYSQIAEKLGVSAKVVKTDLNLARECWRERASNKISQQLHEEIARINAVEQAAWDGWERSMRDAVQTTTEDIDRAIGNESKLKVVRVPQVGNPVFLRMVSECIRQRSELLGLLDPEVREQMNDQDYDEVVSVVIETREQWDRMKPMTYEEFEDAVREDDGNSEYEKLPTKEEMK